jgi:hypothetical protein
VRLNSHQCIGRSRQARRPQQSQKPVRSIYQVINNGLLLLPFFWNSYSRHCIVGSTLEVVHLHLIPCNGDLVTLQ